MTDALSIACDVQRGAAAVGFDWPEVTGAVDKLEEEVAELREALASGAEERATDELGDVLFSAVNVSRFIPVEPAVALERATKNFQKRFALTRARIEEAGKSMESCTLEELDAAWDAVKQDNQGYPDASTR